MGSRSLLLVEAAELFAGEDVEVDVVDGLAGEFADVGDDAVAVRKALLLRELRDDAVDVADDGLILRRHLGGGGKMLLRDDEEVHGGQGADILEDVAELVLIDLGRRDLPRDDLAEQTIRHDGSSFLFLDVGRDEIIDSGQRIVELEGVRAAAHGGIRLAAALAADDRGDIADDVAGLDAARDGVLAADGEQRDLFAVDGAGMLRKIAASKL